MRNSTLEWVVGQSLPKKSVRKTRTRHRTVVHVETSDADCDGYSSVEEVHVVKKNEKKVRFEPASRGVNCPEPAKKEEVKESPKRETCAGSCCQVAANPFENAGKEKAKEEGKNKAAKTDHTCGKSESEKAPRKEEKPKAEICKDCKPLKEGESKTMNDEGQSKKNCNQCGESKESESEKPAKGKGDKDGKASGKGGKAAKQNQKPTPSNTTSNQDTDTNNKPRKMPERVLSASRADVVLREDVIECKSDPIPNAFFDIKTGVLRVYHGPIYGNPFASLIPLSSTMRATGNFSPPLFSGPPPQQQVDPPPLPSSPQSTTQIKPGSPENGWMQILAGLISAAKANNNAQSSSSAPAVSGGDNWGDTSNAVTTQPSGQDHGSQGNTDSWGGDGGAAQTSGQNNGDQTNNDSWGGDNEQAQSGRGDAKGDAWGGNANLSSNNNSSGWGRDSGDQNNQTSDKQGSWGAQGNDNLIQQGQQSQHGQQVSGIQDSWGSGNNSNQQSQQNQNQNQQNQQNTSSGWGQQQSDNNSNNQNNSWGGQNNGTSAWAGDTMNQNVGMMNQDSGNNFNSGGNQGNQGNQSTSTPFAPPADPWAALYVAYSQQLQAMNAGPGQSGFNNNNNSPAQQPNNSMGGPSNTGGGGWGTQGNRAQLQHNMNNTNNSQGFGNDNMTSNTGNNFNPGGQQNWGSGNDQAQQNSGNYAGTGDGGLGWGNNGGAVGFNSNLEASAQNSGW